MQSFGEALSTAIGQSGDSQRVAAKKVGISQTTVSHLIMDRARIPDLPTAAKLLRIYPVLILWLARYVYETGFAEKPCED